MVGASLDFLIPLATVTAHAEQVQVLSVAVHATQSNVIDLSDRFNSTIKNLARPRSGTTDSISRFVVERGSNVSKTDDSPPTGHK